MAKRIPHKVLVVRFTSLGDVAMTLPILYTVAAENRAVEFTLLTQTVASTLLFASRPNIKVITTPMSMSQTKWHDIYSLHRTLRSEGYDVVVDLQDNRASHRLSTLFALYGTKVVKPPYPKRGLKLLTSRHYKVFQPVERIATLYLRTFAKLGLFTNHRFTSVIDQANNSLLAAIAPTKGDKRWIGIAPFAKHESKTYPLERMEQVVRHFAQREDCKVFLFGGGDKEAATLHSWTLRYPSVVSLVTARPGFEVELTLMSQLDLMVTMDSANMHLAAMVATPVLSVWGATHHYAGALGWNQSLADVVEVNMPCRPCTTDGSTPCWRGDYACIKRIAPNDIIDKIAHKLNLP